MVAAVDPNNLRFLKQAIALGELEKADAKRCLRRVKRSGDEADAGEIAERMGLLSSSGRLRVQTAVRRRAKRKKRKRDRQAKSSGSGEFFPTDSASGEHSGSSASGERLRLRRPAASSSDPGAVTDEPLAPATPGEEQAVPADDEARTVMAPTAADDGSAPEGDAEAKDVSEAEAPRAGLLPPRVARQLSPRLLGMCAVSALAGTFTGVALVLASHTGASSLAEASPAQPAFASTAPAVRVQRAPSLAPPPAPQPSAPAPLASSRTRTRPASSAATSGSTAEAASPQTAPGLGESAADKAKRDADARRRAEERARAALAAAQVRAARGEAPADAPSQPGVGVTRERAKAPGAAGETPQGRLLEQVFQAFDASDVHRVGRLVGKLDALGSQLPEARAGRGFQRFLQGDYPAAIEELGAAGEVSGQRGRLALARAYLFQHRYPQALAQLEEGDRASPLGRRIVQLVDGPFRARYPHAAEMLETLSPDGRYRVVTDLGLSPAELGELERKIAAVPAGPARAKLVARLRKKHAGLAELGETMDKAYRAYDKLFGLERRSEIVPTVYVFSQRSLFDAYSRELEVGSTESTLGYYLPYYRVLVFYDMSRPGESQRGKQLLSQETQQVLLHETFHQWIHLYVEGAPHWFNEGLAEYFGIAKLTRKELRYGLVPEQTHSRLSNIRDALRGQLSRPLPLEVLIQADRGTFMEPQRAGVNYAHAWSFVHFLGASKKGRVLLRTYFQALREGLDLVPAYERVFAGIDMVALEKEWEAYVFGL